MWRFPSIPKRWFPAICMLLHLAAPAPSRAESSFTFLQIEDSKYLFKGEGVEGVSAATFTVDYDTTYLFSPEVSVMGGKLLEEDRGAGTPPGNLRFNILNEDHSAVFEACIYFQKRGDYPPVINFVTAEVTDLSGAPRPVPVAMAAPVNVPRSEDTPAVTTPESAPAAPSPGSIVENPVRESGPVSDVLPPAGFPASVSLMPASPVPKADSVPVTPRMKAVAESFRDFKGKKSLAALTALFSGTAPGFRQTPPVLIADGRRAARVVVDGVEGEGVPLFTVSSGRLVSVERGTKDEWILVVRPQEEEWDVWVSCTVANETIDFPLTVAPAIDIPRHRLAELDERTFMPRLRDFLAGKPARGKPRSPAWLREYQFTANYLAARGKR
jgi:hypothetical protein